MRVLFSSKAADWETPQELFDKLDAEFHFSLDVCATDENRKCEQFLTIEDDALKQAWMGVCWMNPPYGRKIGKWVQRARDAASVGSATVVCLLPARTDTAWWHDCIWDERLDRPREGVEVRLLRGRLKFSGHKCSAPFPSAIVVFHGYAP